VIELYNTKTLVNALQNAAAYLKGQVKAHDNTISQLQRSPEQLALAPQPTLELINV
jgi:hypothetical protein